MKSTTIFGAGVWLWAAAFISGVPATDECTKAQIVASGCCDGYSFHGFPPDQSPAANCPTTPAAPGITAPSCPDNHPPTCTATKKYASFPETSLTFTCGNDALGDGSHGGCTTCTKLDIKVVGDNVELTWTNPTGTDLRFTFIDHVPAPGPGDDEGSYKFNSQCAGHTGTCTETITMLQAVQAAFGTSATIESSCGKTFYFRSHYSGVSGTTWAGRTCQFGSQPDWPRLYVKLDITCTTYCSEWCCCPTPPDHKPCDSPQYEPTACVHDEASCPTTEGCDTDTHSSDKVFGQIFEKTCCCSAPTPPQCSTAQGSLTECIAPGANYGCTTTEHGCEKLPAVDVCGHDYTAVEPRCCCPANGPNPTCDNTSPYPDNCQSPLRRVRARSLFGFDTLARSSLEPRTAGTCPGGETPHTTPCPNDPCTGTATTGCTEACCCPTCDSNDLSHATCTTGTPSGAPTSGSCPSSTTKDCHAETVTVCGQQKQLCCCSDKTTPPPSCGTDTFFAAPCPGTSGSCITQTIQGSCNGDRWGWYLTASATTTWNLWAGAGQNILDKGTNVGKATLTKNSDGSWTVTYNLKDGYAITEAHVDVTCAATKVDPTRKDRKGNYPCNPGSYAGATVGGVCDDKDVKTITATIPKSCVSPITLILHGVVSGDGGKSGCALPTC